MSDIKISELAKELNVSSKELIEEINNITGGNIKSASKKIDEDLADLLRSMFEIEEEEEEQHVEEEKKEEEGLRVYDIYHKLKIPFEEVADKLRAIGFQGEITNFTVVDEETFERLKEYIKQEEERKKEEKEKLERERAEKLKVKEKIEKPKEEVKKEEKPEIKKPVEKPEVITKKEKEEAEALKKAKVIEEAKRKAKEEEKARIERERREKIEREKVEKAKVKEKIEKPKEEVKKEEKPEIKKPVEKPEVITKKEKEEAEALKKLLGQPAKKKRKKKKKKEVVSETAVQEEKEEEIKIVSIPEVITVRELAEMLDLPVNQILADLLQRNILATVNQTIDPEIAVEIAEEHGFLAEIEKKEEVSAVEELSEEEQLKIEEEKEENLVERPPIVTVMGHVDHGKTTLLDTIRKTDVAAKEKGGITQHIGAYKIKLPNGKEITFLDTPGHEAFTTLRARGSKVADIAVLVVAADDGVKPQTVEAIDHARNAGLPIIVAVNKIDKPGADPERVKRELSQYGLIPEEWGGDTIFVPVSAKTGQNIEELLENILLVAEILDLKANPNRPAVGTVIESKLDPQRGPLATVLIQTGTLKVGDYFVAGYTWGRVRAMFDERGNRLKEAGPGTPVEILGFNDVPQAGDKFVVKSSEKEARQLAEERKEKLKEEMLARKGRLHLENLKDVKEVNIILKADVQGSLEALKKSIEDLNEKFEDVSINIIHSGIGAINESDVMLAAASNAIIIGFNVRPDASARKVAEEEDVDIKIYGIIYDVIEDLEKALKGMLEPVEKEVLLGTCEVKEIFRVKGVGTVAGCIMTEGVIRRNARARLVRDGIVIYDGEINSLKRFKEDVKEVAKGYECGLTLKDFNDIKPGDIIEAYEMKAEKEE